MKLSNLVFEKCLAEVLKGIFQGQDNDSLGESREDQSPAVEELSVY